MKKLIQKYLNKYRYYHQAGDMKNAIIFLQKAQKLMVRLTGENNPFDAYDYLADELGWDI